MRSILRRRRLQLSHHPLEDVARVEPCAELARWQPRRCRGGRGIGDHIEPPESGQVADQVHRQAGRIEMTVRHVAEHGQRQDGYRRLAVVALREARPVRRRERDDRRRRAHGRRELLLERRPLVADPVLELGVGDVEAGGELRRGAGQVPVLGRGLERHVDERGVEPDPAAIGDEADVPVPEHPAQARELLAQALPALLLAAVAPQLVLEPGPRPPEPGRHPEQREQPLRLAPLRRQLDAAATQQAHRSREPQLQFVLALSVLDHCALSGAGVKREATRTRADGPDPIFAARSSERGPSSIARQSTRFRGWTPRAHGRARAAARRHLVATAGGREPVAGAA